MVNGGGQILKEEGAQCRRQHKNTSVINNSNNNSNGNKREQRKLIKHDLKYGNINKYGNSFKGPIVIGPLKVRREKKGGMKYI